METNMNDEKEKALRNFETARVDVNKALVGKAGAAAENRYGEAYQKLVTLELAPKLKSRYRIGIKHAI